MNIWCVEDDENINNLITYALESQGFEARGFLCYESFKQAMEENIPQLVLLDIMLPDVDGIEILKSLRSDSDTKNIPVIMLTAKNSEIDKVKALDIGADDYIVKPFGVLELISRVKAVLRRTTPLQQTAEDILSVGQIRLEHSKRLVTVEGQTVCLTLKEYNILYLLLQNKGQVFTREQLMDKIWGDSYIGESRTIDMHIKTLRQKLLTQGDCIKTIRGVGYKAE